MAEIQEEEVKLILTDGEEVNVPMKIAEQSKFLKDILEDNEDKTVDISQKVRKPIWTKVEVICKKLSEGEELKEIKKPLGEDGWNAIDEWFRRYITDDVEKAELFELVEVGGKYLNIEPLHQLGCAKIAYDNKDSFIVDIRKYFDLEHDIPRFSQAEEEKLADENIWINEKDPIATQLRGPEGKVVVAPEEGK